MAKMTQKSQDKMSEIDEHIMKRFDIKKRLGKGAYGIVWKAIDKKTGETVAVKKIFDAFRNQTDSQRTFREIMFLQSFRNHPNIIQLHSIHRAANNRDIYLGFEYMDTDLHVVIKRGNILKDCHRRYIMYQLLNATRYIHSGNVIHRDQKPSNVLLDQHCRCKIADFGLARSLAPPSLSHTGPGSGHEVANDSDPTLTDYVATRWYRAPEILIASKRYTKGIDMWSLGCILGEMLAGKPIFPGTSTVNQVEKIMATIPTPTADDIATVCSGIGSSMIKNAVNGCKTSLATLLGEDYSEDALDLVNKLLVFSPNKRLTAEQALEQKYVSLYRSKNLEIILDKDVVPPLNDDVRLSVDDYRNKLYELMSHHHLTRTHKTSHLKKPTAKHMEGRKPEIVRVKPSSVPVREVMYDRNFPNKTTHNSIKDSHTSTKEPHHTVKDIHSSVKDVREFHPPRGDLHPQKPEIYPSRGGSYKEKTLSVQSETKFRYQDNRTRLSSFSVKSESRIPTSTTRNHYLSRSLQQQQSHFNYPQSLLRTSSGDAKTPEALKREQKDKERKKLVLNVKSHAVYSAPFNSYSNSHGIITASALRELKSGVR